MKRNWMCGEPAVGRLTAVVLAALLVVSAAGQALAQEPDRDSSGAAPVPDPALPAATVDESPVLLTLRSVLRLQARLREQIEQARQEFRDAVSEEQKSVVMEEIAELERRLASLKTDFSTTATGIDLASAGMRARESFDLGRELDDFVEPIISELKKLTEQPRHIEQLRGEVSFYEEQLEVVENGLRNLKALRAKSTEPALQAALDHEIEEWEGELTERKNRVEQYSHQLDELLRGQKSFVDTATNAVSAFFRTRGKNLLVTLLVFFGVFFGLRLLYRRLDRKTPWSKLEHRPFYARVLDVVFFASTFVGALLAAMLVLYATGDWVLLGLAIIVLLGIGLAAKNGIPQFYSQARLLLNMGDVREGERVIYRGVPYKVTALSFYTNLYNPLLSGGKVRLPLIQLPGMNSRPNDPDEPWFPCQEGDWVTLSDGVRGRVVTQTPEMVHLVKLGGSKVAYQTVDFLELAPENLSTNFRLNITFGIDYQHQPTCTAEIPEILGMKLTRELHKIVDRADIHNLKVEFAAAGPSSLDYAIIADFAGTVAAKYDVLARAIQKIAVDACNENGWVIPFAQVTVHQADSGGGAAGMLAATQASL